MADRIAFQGFKVGRPVTSPAKREARNHQDLAQSSVALRGLIRVVETHALRRGKQAGTRFYAGVAGATRAL